MPQVETANATSATTPETGAEATRVAQLEAENAQLRARLEDKERHIDDLRNAVRLLEDKRAASAKPRGLLRRLVGALSG